MNVYDRRVSAGSGQSYYARGGAPKLTVNPLCRRGKSPLQYVQAGAGQGPVQHPIEAGVIR